MKNIIKDIEQNCKDKSVEGIIRFLHRSGDIPMTSEHYREVWHFYVEALKFLKNKRKAKKLTMFFMKVNDSKFKRIKARYETRP